MAELHAPMTDNDRVRYHEEKLVQIAKRIYEMSELRFRHLREDRNGHLTVDDTDHMLRVAYEEQKLHASCLALARSYLTASAA